MSKRGRVSQKEIDTVKKYAHKISMQQLAEKLGRSMELTQKIVEEYAPPSPEASALEADRIVIRQELRASEKWKVLNREFDETELKYFEEEYVAMMSQFKGDVLHTESSQIFDAIKLEILKTRNMIARKKALEEITIFEKTLDDFLARFENPRAMQETDKAEVLDLQTRINIAKQREQDKTHEWTKLQERVEKIRAALKANRDQRTKDIENRGTDFVSTIKFFQNRDVQERKSRELQLVRMAGQRELQALGESHQYEDGTWDSPILSADTLADDDGDGDASGDGDDK